MNNQDFCGIVFIGGGSSWHYAATKEEAAQKAAKQAKSDWKTLFKFKRKQEFKVAVYDTSKCDGWWADYSGVYPMGSNDPLPLVERVTVTV
jgi:hypothetical protein